MLESAAYRYINGELQKAYIESDIELSELLAVSDNVELADKNIASFIAGGPCLNMLLWGEKGSGKSTLLKLLSLKYAKDNLVTIEFLDESVGAIYNLYKIIRQNSHKKFILFFDDISFNTSDSLRKDDYLDIVKMYLQKYNIEMTADWEKQAESYAIDRGGRSGRLAKQFAAYLYIQNM